jgi:hypothetical protein
MIHAQIAAIDPAGNRVAARRLVNFGARVRSGQAGGSRGVLVIDLSPGGCKLLNAGDLDAGIALWIKLPGLEARRLHVVWNQADELGCEFSEPLDDDDMAACRAAPQPAGKRRRPVFGLRGTRG